LTRRSKATSTSAFGVSRRESHDSTAFYRRFTPPVLSHDDAIARPSEDSIDRIHCCDARRMAEVGDASVALVVTSPPYFAGKEYEKALGEQHVPSTYLDYLELLHDVFRECAAKLEPGGRIAVNVANLGRKPYRSLSADVISILQDRLGLLLRGEIIWVKGKAAGNSTAWGSFRSAANPVLRDLTERVVIASKGRFNRGVARRTRAARGLPHEVSVSKDEFMEATTDVWDIPPESARRVGHPAPFPVELPQRLIELYTYRNDLVLDPFMGSGSTAVAALRTRRHYVGYDVEPDYVALAEGRARRERERLDDAGEHAIGDGRAAREIAFDLLRVSGYTDIVQDEHVAAGVHATFVATDARGERVVFDLSGGLTATRGGLRRIETMWRVLGRAAAIATRQEPRRLVLLSTELPLPGSSGDAALRAARGGLFVEAIDITSPGADRALRELNRP
jgi:DNA modification methylase